MFMPDSTSHDRNSGFHVLVVKRRPVSMVAAGELVPRAGRRTIGKAVLLRAKAPFHRFCSLKYTRPLAWRRARPLCRRSRRPPSDQINNAMKDLLPAHKTHKLVAKCRWRPIDQAVGDSIALGWAWRTANSAGVRLEQPSHSCSALHRRQRP